jgi:hypothetical protein
MVLKSYFIFIALLFIAQVATAHALHRIQAGRKERYWRSKVVIV